MVPNNNCLVLRIVEKDDEYQTEYKNIFIIYEPKYNSFFVTGKRNTLEDRTFKPFTFYMHKPSQVMRFIETIFSAVNEFNDVEYSLYNYYDLPKTCDSITYTMLRMHVSKTKEILSSDNICEEDKRQCIKNLLNMLKDSI